MPCISQFFGILIYMYYNDHAPPHFHARYGGNEALYEIETLRIYAGQIPRRAHNLVIEWGLIYIVLNYWQIGREPDKASRW